MKVLRLIERIAHWIGLFLGIVAIVAVGVGPVWSAKGEGFSNH